MLGEEVFGRVEVVNHDARDRDSLVYLGVHGNGVPVWINRRWVEADLRITTGFVEPHFFAGFSGGPKLVTPGLAGLDTVLVLHDAVPHRRPARDLGRDPRQPGPRRHPRRGRGCAGALLARRDPQPRAADHHRIRGRDGSRCTTPHAPPRDATRCSRSRSRSTSSSRATPGFPLDQNLYQAVKGMSAAAKIVKDGRHDRLRRRVPRRLPRPRALTASCSARARPRRSWSRRSRRRRRTIPDQWQVQIQANIQVARRSCTSTPTTSPTRSCARPTSADPRHRRDRARRARPRRPAGDGLRAARGTPDDPDPGLRAGLSGGRLTAALRPTCRGPSPSRTAGSRRRTGSGCCCGSSAAGSGR